MRRDSGQSKAGWTTVRIELLEKLWRDGLSASAVAARLGGVTRNAVIAKLHREGIKRPGQAPRQSGIRTSSRRRRKPTKVPIQFSKFGFFSVGDGPTEPSLPPSDDLFGPFFDLDARPDDGCRYFHGDPKVTRMGYCTRTHLPGLPYCAHHAAQCFRAPMPNERAATIASKAGVPVDLPAKPLVPA